MEDDGTRSSRRWSSFHTFLFLWNSFCVYLIFDSWSRTSEDIHEIITVLFQPIIPLFGMLWLWGVNIRVFEILHIPYENLFEDTRYLLSSFSLFEIAAAFTTLFFTAVASFLYLINVDMPQTAAWIPFLFGLVSIIVWLTPIRGFYGQNRIFFFKTCLRVLFPINPVSFSDFLLADVLTSLARSLSDLERGSCMLFIYSTMNSPDADVLEEQCGRRSWLANFVLALPYIIRMFQCLQICQKEKDRAQFFNAVKYFTVFPVIVCSMMRHRAESEDWILIWRRLWVCASMINTAYSYYWDVEMDWDISWFRNEKQTAGISWFPVIRADAIYSPKALYYFALLSNFLIRVAWIYKLSLHLNYVRGIHLLVAVLEICRRCQWIFIRFENGLRKTYKTQSIEETRAKV